MSDSNQPSKVPQLPLTLHPSPGKMLWLLLACGAFVAGGIFIARRGDPLLGYGCAAFFGLGIPVAIMQMIPGKSYLRLETAGFTIGAWRRSQFYPWNIVKNFEVTRIGLNQMIAWDFTEGHRTSANLKALSKSLAGYEAALPDTYGLKAKALCDLLNAIRTASITN